MTNLPHSKTEIVLKTKSAKTQQPVAATIEAIVKSLSRQPHRSKKSKLIQSRLVVGATFNKFWGLKKNLIKMTSDPLKRMMLMTIY